jgi:glycosyltransferase involved in cell wall biosynthesis
LTPRVATIGIRGVPANFGGSETAVQEIGRRLAAEGVDFVVYCRAHKSPNPDTRYLGMRRIVLPSVNTFNFDTISHSLLSSLHVLLRNEADVVHFHGMGNALCLPLFLASRKKTVITIDGPDWERPKWGAIARRVLKLSARLAVRWADQLIIDNKPTIEYFAREFGYDDAVFITYGADTEKPPGNGYVEALGLEPRRYLLFVGALVPDKGPDLLVDAYRRVPGEMPLVVVGDSPFFPEFRDRLRAEAERDPRVRMLGYVYDEPYRELVVNAYAYVHPLRSDGTSPALLQALGYGNCVVASGVDEAREAVGDAALVFRPDDADDLARQLERVLSDPDLAEEYRRRALRRVEEEYSWDDVAAKHRELYERLVADARR